MTKRSVFMVMVLLFAVMAAPMLLAQTVAQGVQDVASTAALPGHTAEWGSAVVWGFMSSSIFEWAKRSRRISWISDRMAWGAQRLIGVLVAVATAAGIHWSFDAAAGTLAITGLTWIAVQTAIGESLRQWVMQEMTYRVAVKNFGQEREA